MWPFFHKSFEEYYCGLFVAQLGSELSSVSSPAYAPPLASDRSLLCTRLLRHLLPNAPHDPLSFFVGLLKSSYWSAVLEFAACKGGAAWLLSIYRPTLLAKLPSVKRLRFFPAATEYALLRGFKDENVLFSREGVLLILCAFDSLEATREEAERLLTEIASLVPVQISTTTDYVRDNFEFSWWAYWDLDVFLYCAVHDRAEILKLLLQLFPNTSRVQNACLLDFI
jgi:hypothetical protein